MIFDHMHIPTLLDVSVLVTMVMALVLVGAWRYNPSVPGTGQWAGAGVLSIWISLTLSIHESLPPGTRPLVTALLIPLVAGLTWTGSLRYMGERITDQKLSWLLIGTGSLLVIVSIIWIPGYTARFTAFNTLSSLLFVLAGRTLLVGNISQYPARYLLGTGFVIHGLFVMSRPFFISAPSGLDTQPLSVAELPALLIVESILFFVVLVLGTVMLINERISAELRTFAERDPLTNVFNRRTFSQLLDKAVAIAQRQRFPITLLVVDLDRFKSINDTYGHKAGDDVLRNFVTVALANLRKEDLIGRLGGEEFMIALMHSDAAQAKLVAERLRTSVETTRVVSNRVTLKYTISIGIAESLPTEDTVHWIERADQAMYRAKHAGRNRVALADA